MGASYGFMWIMLFILGATLGSFINVLAVRYDPERFLFSRQTIGGRSHCPKCRKTLRWFELVPVISFCAQGGRCKRCASALSFQYLVVELAAGLICVFVPMKFSILNSILWTLVFLTLLLITLIDLRLSIIPDEANVFLAVLGIALAAISAAQGASANGSFLGSYAHFFGSISNPWLNHAVSALSAGLFFALLIALTRGQGMGMGDLKFAIPLGFLFGWPDTALLIGLAFVVGALYGVGALMYGGKTMKSAVPFGPFLALASTIIFFWGADVFRWYAGIFS